MFKKNRLIAFGVEDDAAVVAAAALRGFTVTRFVRDYSTWVAKLILTGGDATKGELLKTSMVRLLDEQRQAWRRSEVNELEEIAREMRALAARVDVALASRGGE